MTKIYSMMIFTKNNNDYKLEFEHYNMSWFYRSELTEITRFISTKLIKESTKTTIVTYGDYNLLMYYGKRIIAVSYKVYDKDALLRIVRNLDDQLDKRTETEYITNYVKQMETPETIDKIYGLQRNLDEIKNIMTHNIEKILEREGKLDDILMKSEDLSKRSKDFLIGAKKMNSCCAIL